MCPNFREKISCLDISHAAQEFGIGRNHCQHPEAPLYMALGTQLCLCNPGIICPLLESIEVEKLNLQVEQTFRHNMSLTLGIGIFKQKLTELCEESSLKYLWALTRINTWVAFFQWWSFIFCFSWKFLADSPFSVIFHLPYQW